MLNKTGRWRVTKVEGSRSRRREIHAEAQIAEGNISIFFPDCSALMHSFEVKDVVAYGLEVPDLIFMDIQTVSGLRVITLRATTPDTRAILEKIREERVAVVEKDNYVLLRGYLEKKRYKFPMIYQRRYCMLVQGADDKLHLEYYSKSPAETSDCEKLGTAMVSTSSTSIRIEGIQLIIEAHQLEKDKPRIFEFRCDGPSTAMLWKMAFQRGVAVCNASKSSNSHSPDLNNSRAGGSRRRQTLQVTEGGVLLKSDAVVDNEELDAQGNLGNMPQKPGRYNFEYCVRPGFDPIDKDYKKECQDQALIAEAYSDKEDSSFVGVFDGHGQNGRKASAYVKNAIARLVAEFTGNNYEKKFAYSCLQAEELLKQQGFDVRLSGTTATFGVIDETDLHVGWTGDSRMVLGQWDEETNRCTAVDLTVDHKPTDPGERERIEEAGGMVMKLSEEPDDDTPARVFDSKRPHLGPGIAMSRSIGDTNATALGVIPQPMYRHHKIGESDRFAIVASDGLWEVFESKEAVEWVYNYMEDMHMKGIAPGMTPDTGHLIVSQQIAEEAQKRWVKNFNAQEVVDDTSVLIVFFKTEGKYIPRGGRASIVQDFSTSSFHHV